MMGIMMTAVLKTPAIRLCLLSSVALLATTACQERAKAGQPSEDPAVAARAEARRTAVATIKVNLDQAAQTVRSLEETFRVNKYGDVARHGSELVALARDIRRQSINLSDSDGEVVRLIVDRLEHAAHEVQEAGEAGRHEDVHHAFESLQTELVSLRERANRL